MTSWIWRTEKAESPPLYRTSLTHRCLQKMSKTDDVATKIETGQENDAEDMFAIMEHFRMMTTIKVDGPVVESDEIDLLILMGNYLRTVDV